MRKEYSYQMVCRDEIAPEKRTCYIYEEYGEDGALLRELFNGCEYVHPCEECEACEAECWALFRSSTL